MNLWTKFCGKSSNTDTNLMVEQWKKATMNVCGKCYANYLVDFKIFHRININPDLLLVHKNSGNYIRIQLGTMNVCRKFNGNPANVWWVISIWTKVVDNRTYIAIPTAMLLAWLQSKERNFLMTMLCLLSLRTSQNLQDQGGGRKDTATLKAETQQILIEVKIEKATEGMVERSGER